jgi:8-oxo-dGTP diphosphatase
MSFEDAKRKDVVCAILSRRVGNEEQFLIGKRSGSNVFNGLFEFPGGKVEHGESLSSALKREIREELGAEVEVKGFFMHPFPFDYSEDEDGVEGYIKLFPMICTLRADSHDPIARDGVHKTLTWVNADSFGLFDMLRADMPIARKIQMDYHSRSFLNSMGN